VYCFSGPDGITAPARTNNGVSSSATFALIVFPPSSFSFNAKFHHEFRASTQFTADLRVISDRNLRIHLSAISYQRQFQQSIVEEARQLAPTASLMITIFDSVNIGGPKVRVPGE
jgi:hypothetical protein